VPEVNPQDIKAWREKGIIANPNCSTIQMVLALKPLYDLYGDIKRVDVSTYQAVSGAGKSGMEELVMQMKDFFAFKLDESEHKAFPYQIALNVIPQVDKPMENGYTKEEMKMTNETAKIMGANIPVSATCVRVPVLRSHSEAVTVTFPEDVVVDVEKVRLALNDFEDVEVIDNLEKGLYPMPITATNSDITYVGRIRKDIFSDNILHMWVVADQIRVGAGTNAVRNWPQKWAWRFRGMFLLGRRNTTTKGGRPLGKDWIISNHRFLINLGGLILWRSWYWWHLSKGVSVVKAGW